MLAMEILNSTDHEPDRGKKLDPFTSTKPTRPFVKETEPISGN
jgi:hypothetical protein